MTWRKLSALIFYVFPIRVIVAPIKIPQTDMNLAEPSKTIICAQEIQDFF